MWAQVLHTTFFRVHRDGHDELFMDAPDLMAFPRIGASGRLEGIESYGVGSWVFL